MWVQEESGIESKNDNGDQEEDCEPNQNFCYYYPQIQCVHHSASMPESVCPLMGRKRASALTIPKAYFRIRRLEELVPNAHCLVSLRNRPVSLALEPGKRPYCVHVLRHDHALIVHLIHHIRFTISYV
jgi:hypothetical protein